MVKTKGSALALGATGTVGQALTFSSHKGTSYVKTKSVPRLTRTARQQSIRETMRYLTQTWPTLSAGDQATWNASAAANRFTPQNAYVQYNQARFHRGRAPTETYPAAETGPLPMLFLLAIDAYHNVRSLKRNLVVIGGPADIGFMIWYNQDWTNPWSATSRVHFHRYGGSSPDVVFIPVIEPAVWYPWLIAFTSTGKQSAPAFNAFFIVHDS